MDGTEVQSNAQRPAGAAEASAAQAPAVAVRRRRAAGANLSLLPRIFESFVWNQRDKALEQGKELAKQIENTHPAVAQRLMTVLARALMPARLPPTLPEGLVEMSTPRHALDAVTLTDQVRCRCRDIITEHARQHDLAAFGLTPRHKVLFYGPTGNGKTMLAEALAWELGLPFLVVRYGGLLDSYLGSTGKNLDKVFAYARTAPCVLFIDEFDGIAIKRGSGEDVGEIRRVTNHLMIEIERLPASVVLVCATNAYGLLDEAIKRRFDFAIAIPSPTRDLRLHRARDELRPELTPGHDLSAYAERIADLNLENLHFVTERCRELRRDLVLNAGGGIDELASARRGESFLLDGV
ncbi:AAA family ATPase [Metallibacterium scheffleri]|nr:ATP-binding protein [Metallibacterium scheffleri]